MRIISGKYRSRQLIAPESAETRPTSDRARETLFNILANLVDFDGCNVLDLFAGSGAFAFESLSRGAAKATCVDRTKESVEAIRTNAQKLDCLGQTKILRSDVYSWLRQGSDTYDIIFADAPYDDAASLSDLPRLLFSSRLLTPDSIVILEVRSTSSIIVPDGVTILKERIASLAKFIFLQASGNSDEANNQTSDLSGDVRSDHERTP